MTIKIAEFYRTNACRLVEIRSGAKGPILKGWQDSKKSADDVEPLLDGVRFNKFGWVLDPSHLVVDVDMHDDAKNGFQSLERLQADLGCGSLFEAADTIVETPGGGLHLYFCKPADIKVRKSLPDVYPGLDFLSAGSQVICAGSLHDASERQYRFAEGCGLTLASVPIALLDRIQDDRQAGLSAQNEQPKERRADPVRHQADRAGDEFNTSATGLRIVRDAMATRGYAIRDKGDFCEWDRPGKQSGNHCSGHLGKVSKAGNYQVYCFSTADSVFPPCESISIFHAFAMLCHGGNHTAAAADLHDCGFAVEDASEVDLSFFLGTARSAEEDDSDDEAFAAGMVPAGGILREIFDAYWQTSYRRCAVMGLATSIAVAQTIFGRKVQSWTGLATNDYHLILAPTTSGKEGPLTFVNKLLSASQANELVMPERIQSGNGLLAALKKSPCGIWMCDEFGFVLASILDKKNRDTNAKAIAQNLLSLYGKSSSRFSGSAYAAGVSHEIEAPHLSVVGVSTGHTVFREIGEDQVMDGMLGRIAFWRVNERPEKNRDINPEIPAGIAERVCRWVEWHPYRGNMAGESFDPLRLAVTDEAKDRWESHEDAIDARMNAERAVRSAMWGRVAARSMKLAVVHRMSRCDPAEINQFSQPTIEIEDINWGIKIANWCANLASDLIRETVPDKIGNDVANAVLKVLTDLGGSATMTQISRRNKRSDAAQIRAAVAELEAAGFVTVTTKQDRKAGRPSVLVERIK